MRHCIESDWTSRSNVRVVGDSRVRESWLLARRTRLTASQAAAALDMSKWATFDDIVAEKRGEAEDWKPSQHAYMGTMREECNLRILGDVMGLEVRPNTLLLETEGTPGMACTPDGLVIFDPPPNRGYDYTKWAGGQAAHTRFLELMGQYSWCPVDVKSVSAKNDYLWRDGPPLEYETQLQCDLAVLHWPFGLVVAFIDSWRIHCCLVERDPIVTDVLREAAERLRKALTAPRT